MPVDLDMCKNAETAVDEFYWEIKKYIYPLGNEPFHKCLDLANITECAHFVQIMWAKTQQIGCSYASCIGCSKGVEAPKIIINCYYDARELYFHLLSTLFDYKI